MGYPHNYCIWLIFPWWYMWNKIFSVKLCKIDLWMAQSLTSPLNASVSCHRVGKFPIPFRYLLLHDYFCLQHSLLLYVRVFSCTQLNRYICEWSVGKVKDFTSAGANGPFNFLLAKSLYCTFSGIKKKQWCQIIVIIELPWIVYSLCIYHLCCLYAHCVVFIYSDHIHIIFVYYYY